MLVPVAVNDSGDVAEVWLKFPPTRIRPAVSRPAVLAPPNVTAPFTSSVSAGSFITRNPVPDVLKSPSTVTVFPPIVSVPATPTSPVDDTPPAACTVPVTETLGRVPDTVLPVPDRVTRPAPVIVLPARTFPAASISKPFVLSWAPSSRYRSVTDSFLFRTG